MQVFLSVDHDGPPLVVHIYAGVPAKCSMLTDVFVPFGKGAFQQGLHSVIEYNNNTISGLVCHSCSSRRI